MKPIILTLTHNEKLGDAVLRIPMYRALRLAFPEHKIVCASAEGSAWPTTLSAVLEEFIDQVLLNQPLKSVSGVRSLVRRLGQVQYLLDLRSGRRPIPSYLATAGLPVKYISNSPGFIRRNIAGVERRPPTNAQRWHRMAEIMAGRLLPFEAELQLLPQATVEAKRLVTDRQFVLLSPGEGRFKFWDRQKWLGLASHIEDAGMRPVFLIGPPEQEQRLWIDPAGHQVIDASSAEAELLPWVFHALADRALAVVAAESGIGHLAATRSAALLTIAGPTNARLWRPVTPHHWVIEAREFGSTMAKDIPLKAVAERLDEILRQRAPNTKAARPRRSAAVTPTPSQ